MWSTQVDDVAPGRADRPACLGETGGIGLGPVRVGLIGPGVAVLVPVRGLVAELDLLDREVAVGAPRPEASAGAELGRPATEVLRLRHRRDAPLEPGQQQR